MTLPPEVLLVQALVPVQEVEVLRQTSGRVEVFDVYEGVRRRDGRVVLLPGSHHHRHNVVPATK